MGDFNIPLVPEIDRQSTALFRRGRESLEIGGLLVSTGLVDVWRYMNPGKREFTFFSTRHKTFSRLDYIFWNNANLSRIVDVSFLPRIISDHCPVKLVAKWQINRRNDRMWRSPPGFFLSVDNCCALELYVEEVLKINQAGDTSAAARWETLKLLIRTHIQTLGKQKTYRESCEIKILEARLKVCEALRQAQLLKHLDPSPMNVEIQEIQHKLISIDQTQINANLFHAKRLRFLESERCGKTLAWRLRYEAKLNHILAIRGESGALIHDSREINERFFRYYRSIYNMSIPCSLSDFSDVLSNITLPTIDVSAMDLLEKPLALGELFEAVKSLAVGKAPGTDGLPSELYRLLSTKLLRPLRDMYLEAYENGTLPNTVQQSIISLFLKEGKDPEECSAYRPISLLNIDTKILATVMATRLKGILPLLIDSAQVGFVLNRGVIDHFQFLHQILYGERSKHKGDALILLDLEKSF